MVEQVQRQLGNGDKAFATLLVDENGDPTSAGGGAGGEVTQGAAGDEAWLVENTAQIVTNDGTPVRVGSSATAVQLAAAASRSRLCIENVSTAILYLRFGANPVITGGSEVFDVLVPANSRYEDPQPVDVRSVNGIWASANGYAMVSEGLSNV